MILGYLSTVGAVRGPVGLTLGSSSPSSNWNSCPWIKLACGQQIEICPTSGTKPYRATAVTMAVEIEIKKSSGPGMLLTPVLVRLKLSSHRVR
jgi:hypothetical protein